MSKTSFRERIRKLQKEIKRLSGSLSYLEGALIEHCEDMEQQGKLDQLPDKLKDWWEFAKQEMSKK